MAALMHRRWRRTRLVAAAGVAATLLVALAPASRGGEEVVAGSGDAQASVVRVGPTAGGLQVAVTFGQSLADYQGGVARGQSRVLDPGVLGLVLSAESCTGSPPPLDPSVLPPTLRADSREEGAAEGKEGTYLAAPPLGGLGHQQVRATEDPSGSATTTLAALEVPGLLRMDGGTATTETMLLDGTTRVARAVTTLGDLDLGGVVRMEGMRWAVEHRSGPGYPDDVEVATTFSFGRLVVAGTELPAPATPAEVSAAFDQLNQALAPTGLSVRPPAVQRDGDIVRVTPMAVRINQSELGRQTIGRGLEALNPAREPAVDALLSANCQFGSIVLVGDVALGVGAGSGGLLLELGGVQAMTEGLTFANPFGTVGAGFGGPVPPEIPATTPGALPDGPAGDAPGDAAPVAVPPREAAPPPAGDATVEIDAGGTGPVALTEPASSDEPAPAVLVGLLALAAVAAMAAADYAHMRRAQFVMEAR